MPDDDLQMHLHCHVLTNVFDWPSGSTPFAQVVEECWSLVEECWPLLVVSDTDQYAVTPVFSLNVRMGESGELYFKRKKILGPVPAPLTTNLGYATVH